MNNNTVQKTTPVGLPNDLNYSLPSSLPSARNQEVVIQPSNGTTYNSAGQVIQFAIPCQRNAFLDPHTTMVRFKNTYTTTPAVGDNTNHGSLLGTSASPFIMQSVYANDSNLLEQIGQHGVLYNALVNSTMTDAEKRGMDSMLHCDNGFGVEYACSTNFGHRIGANVNGGDGIDGHVFDYSFPLLGILGANSNKFIPLHSLTTLRFELMLDALTNFVKTTGTFTVDSFSITDVEFVCNIVTLSDEAMAMVNMANPDKVYLKSRSWKESSATLPSGANGNYSLQVGWRASSLVGILTTCHNSAMIDGKFGSICPNLTQPSNFVINSTNYPQRGMNPTEKPGSAFASLQKFWGSLSSTAHCGSISNESFLRSSTATGLMKAFGTNFDNMFYLGIDTEVTSKSSTSLLSGIDVNSSPVFFNAQISTALSAHDHTLHFFGHYDVLIEFDPMSKSAIANF